MFDAQARRGLDSLRRALADIAWRPALQGPGVPGLEVGGPAFAEPLLSEAVAPHSPAEDGRGRIGDRGSATSSSADAEEGHRLIALVELARSGDAEAFGQLFDHYHPSVYRFLSYRLGSVTLAEDLTSETFLRALRSISSFRWQGKDFGAWLMVIARNLANDHFKSGRARLELSSDNLMPHDTATEGPESMVLAELTNQALMRGLRQLPADQQDCLVMRFLQDLSIAETATALDRSEGAVKQLQLRAVRNLAKLLPEGL